MSNAMYFGTVVALGGTLEYPSPRGPFAAGPLIAIARQTVSTDPIGSTTVTFSGVHAGTEIRVYLPDGSLAAGVEECDANHVLSWQVYAAGSANNTVTIRIVNTAYRIKEFDYTSTVGAVSLPVQQEPDKWYRNPV